MKFGVCAGVTPDTIETAKKIIDIGYDFIETNIGCVVSMTDDEIEYCAELQKINGITTPCANLLFPGWKLNRTIHLTGPERDIEWENTYMNMLMPRCAKLGLKVLVFGSGGARNMPDGYDPGIAFSELTDLCRRLGECAAKYDITIAIEPLRKQECNIIQTVQDGFKLVNSVQHPNVRLLADIYHIYNNKETIDYPQALVDSLTHVHWADPSTRAYPTISTPEMQSLADVLNQKGYNKTISIEGEAKNLLDDAVLALNTLKKLF